MKQYQRFLQVKEAQKKKKKRKKERKKKCDKSTKKI